MFEAKKDILDYKNSRFIADFWTLNHLMMIKDSLKYSPKENKGIFSEKMLHCAIVGLRRFFSSKKRLCFFGQIFTPAPYFPCHKMYLQFLCYKLEVEPLFAFLTSNYIIVFGS